MHYKVFGWLLIVSGLSGCGDSSNSTPIEIPPLPAGEVMQTGIFLDSPVANLSYTTASTSGVTNALGEYGYLPGEMVTFSIGDLSFPAVRGGSVITPLHLVGTADPTNSAVLNIVSLFLTLDQDANPDNGIVINDTAKSIATQIDFELSAADFGTSGAVTNLIFNAGQDQVVSGLVASADALTHFEAELVANDISFGTIAQQDDRTIKKYLADNNLIAEQHDSGLHYHIINAGTGGFPEATSTVVVKYKGTLLNGTVFDQTANDTSTEFQLNGLIAGWQIGIRLLQKGGSAILYIPSALGYGSAGSGSSIPADAVLIFEIELVDFS